MFENESAQNNTINSPIFKLYNGYAIYSSELYFPLPEDTKLTCDYYITLRLEIHYAIKYQNRDNKEG